MPVGHSPSKESTRQGRGQGQEDLLGNPSTSQGITGSTAGVMSIRFPTGALSSVTRKINEIKPLLTYNENLDVVELELAELLTRLEKFDSAVQEELQREGITEEQRQGLLKWHGEKRTIIVKAQERILKWAADKKDQAVTPGDSVSQASSNPSIASVRSTTSSAARIRLAEEEAQLKARQERSEELGRIQEERQRLQRQHEDEQRRLKEAENEVNIAIEKRRLNRVREAIDEIENANAPNRSDQGGAAAWSPLRSYHQRSEQDHLKDQITLLAEIAQRSHLPKSEPEVFDGNDVTRYKPFIQAFNILISNKTSSFADRLYYLEKYTKDEPRELVRSCFLMDPREGYNEALKLLDKHYGNEFQIASAYLQRLQKWPTIKNDDVAGLKKLNLFLKSCGNFMRNVSGLNQLNGPTQVQEIVKKLPFKMREAWRRTAFHLIEAQGSISFKDLVNFVDEQVRIVSLPVFGEIKDSTEGRESKERRIIAQPKKTISFATNAVINEEQDHCPLCHKENHKLPKCFFFAKKTHDDKIKFIRDNALCFSCLSKDHVSRHCTNRMKCQKCSRLHPTCLHKPVVETSSDQASQGGVKLSQATTLEEEAESKATSACCKSRTSNVTGAGNFRKIALALIPVKLRVRSTKKTIITYAGLDNFASDCFISDRALALLGISGQRTEINLTTMDTYKRKIVTKAVNDLEVLDLDENEKICLPVTFSRERLPIDQEDVLTLKDIMDMPEFEEVPFQFVDAGVGLMLGANVPEAIKPLEIIDGPAGGPYASKHRLGWALNGPVREENGVNRKVKVNRVKVEYHDIEEKLRIMYDQDFKDQADDGIGPSIEDAKWLKQVERSVTRDEDGHFQISLPFRNKANFPNNRKQALQRVKTTQRKLKRDPELRRDYEKFMNMMIKEGFAEPVPEEEVQAGQGQVWYLVHHGIRHKQKKKLRVVFDCSLKYAGTSLNDQLLSGPDLANNLLGVLLRFRQGSVALTGDLKNMFYQVRIPVQDRNFLRYLWYPEGDLDQNPVDYRLKVHVFGAVSSPSAANFALRRGAEEMEGKVSQEAVKIVKENFYVDDMLVSVDTVKGAKALIDDVHKICDHAKFKLHQFISNRTEVFEQVEEGRAQDLDFDKANQIKERALGVFWDTHRDLLTFVIKIQDKPMTRRGLLSTIFSIYDPLGLVSPAILPAKQVFQELCRRGCDWDQLMPEDLRESWSRWLEDVHLLSKFTIPRWYGSTKTSECQLHIFSDGSEVGYGSVAYFRIVTDQSVVCSLIMAKSLLAPLKKMSIPRLELSAAKLGVKLMTIVTKGTRIKISSVTFWVDSEVTLKYIRSESRRFQRFVANRIAFIRERTKVEDWRFVPGKINVADMASRGVPVTDLLSRKEWKNGPDFLRLDPESWPRSEDLGEIDDEHLEVKKKQVVSAAVEVQLTASEQYLESASTWNKLIWRMKSLIKFQRKVKARRVDEEVEDDVAKEELIRCIQEEEFSQERTDIEFGGEVGRRNRLRKLAPFIDRKGLLRVGGRVDRAQDVPYDQRHPLLLPCGHVARLLVQEAHRQVGHLGRESVRCKLREKYWIIKESVVIKKVLRQCVHCRRYQGKPGVQVMSELPEDRLESSEPVFTNVGLDLFGPFKVVRGRSVEERYGLVFTCLVSRAVHFEVVFSKSTSSFIQALRRFIARRGQVKVLRSDRGTNFVGAERELRELLEEIDQDQVREEVRRQGVKFVFNCPQYHHAGGVWERQIRTFRKVMAGLLDQHPKKLTDEELSTLMCEVEAIVNGRPLTSMSDDPNDLTALTPNHLLLLKSGPTFPPGLFDPNDTYSKKRWKQVQFLADNFWRRWKSEYLSTLQERQKWTHRERSFKVNDLVLLVKENTPRCQWPLGRVLELYPSEDGQVRKVRVKTSDSEYDRPVSQLVVLQEREDS